MFRIFPTVESPESFVKLTQPFVIESAWIPGCRTMALCRYLSDDSRFIVDLSAGFGTLSQGLAVLKGETFEPKQITNLTGHSPWYVDQLSDGLLAPDNREFSPTVICRQKSSRVVIVNCIDDLYGHSLLKLLNCSRHLSSQDIGVCVLAPKALANLIPESVAEKWIVDIPLREGVRIFPKLAKWLQDRFHQYDEVFLSKTYCQLPPEHYDLRQFLPSGLSPLKVNSRPVIAFHARHDRTWGSSTRHQDRRIKALFDELNWRFPSVDFYVLGFGKPISLPQSNFHDLRTSSLNQKLELDWFSIMMATDVAIGVHGSNMLLPSGLAKSTVQLLPEFKYPTLATDLLFPPDLTDPRDVLARYAVLYGDDKLLEISATRVAKTVAYQLSYGKSNQEWFSLSPSKPFSNELSSLLQDKESQRGFYCTKGRSIVGRLLEWTRRIALLRLASWIN